MRDRKPRQASWRVFHGVVACLAAAVLVASLYVPFSPLSTDVWAYLILRPILGAGLAAAGAEPSGATALLWPLGGAFLIFGSLAQWMLAGARRATRSSGAAAWMAAVAIVLALCAVSAGLAASPEGPSCLLDGRALHAASVALLGALIAVRSLVPPRRAARGLAAATGLCIASYVLLPVGLLLLAGLVLTVGVRASRKAPPALAD